MKSNTQKQSVLITGATSGIGKHAAKHLLQQGYQVILACRNPEKGADVQKWLHRSTDNTSTQLLPLDLSSFTSIREATGRIAPSLFGLVCNAGVSLTGPTQYTEEGIEQTFAVNHLGHFLLSLLILKKCPELQRIAIVSSSLHDPELKSPFTTHPYRTVEELAFPEDPPHPDWSRINAFRYNNSKLCNLLFAYELIRKLKESNRKEVLVNAFNPGLIPGTGLGRHNTGRVRFIWYYIMPLLRPFIGLMRSADQAGKQLSYLISQVSETGQYFDMDHPTTSSKESYDVEKAHELWEYSASLADLRKDETPFS